MKASLNHFERTKTQVVVPTWLKKFQNGPASFRFLLDSEFLLGRNSWVNLEHRAPNDFSRSFSAAFPFRLKLISQKSQRTKQEAHRLGQHCMYSKDTCLQLTHIAKTTFSLYHNNLLKDNGKHKGRWVSGENCKKLKKRGLTRSHAGM